MPQLSRRVHVKLLLCKKCEAVDLHNDWHLTAATGKNNPTLNN